MIYVIFGLNYLLMIAMPLVLGRWVARRRGAGWAYFGMGAVTFVASQVLHIPFNWLILQKWQLLPRDTAVLSNLIILSLFLGLSAGVFEEVARYMTFRFWAKGARSWGTGLMLGVGHGGIEAILLALLGILGVGQLALIDQGWFAAAITAEQRPLIEAIITETFSAPWNMVLLGALERGFALCAHLAMSLLVMQVLVRGQVRWLGLSILWHTVLNATAVVVVTKWGAVAAEGALGVLTLFSVGIIFWLRTPEPVEPEPEPLPELKPVSARGLEEAAEILERSKFT
ncbi:MAG: YhfC family intramembrane metalloprotease [Ardenticatenaceae bacterium]|nr:YhfC family intramembrane metalloprotease [Ardenticatenaceae bacterium]